MKIFYNGTIITMDSERPEATAVVEQNGKILEILDHKPSMEGQYIDLEGKTLLPGFIDTHTHCLSAGLYSMGINLEGCKYLAEVFERLKAGNKLGNKVIAWHLDEMQLAEKRFPLAEELDDLFPDQAVLIRRVDGHSCVINSYSAHQIKSIQPLSSNFNGTLRKGANDRAVNWFHQSLDEETILKCYDRAAEHASQSGHTTIHTMVGDGHNSPEHFKLLKQNLNRFPIEFVLYAQCFNLEAALEAGAERLGGCILADGSFGSHTAALIEPYYDQPDNYGELYHSDELWLDLINRVHEHNLQFAVHCIGDRAISQILRCYEQVQKTNPKDLRHILIHNELTSDEMVSRMSKAGVAAAMQPMFDRLWAGENGLYEQVLGKERTKRTNRLRSLTDAGIVIGGGSDWYVTELDALAGIDAATRIHNPAERLTPYEAIKLYTSNAAWLSHDEHRLGKIKEGWQADFAILAENPLKAVSIKDIDIAAVYKKGEKISG